MQSILELLDESNLIWDRLLTNNHVVEVYKATTIIIDDYKDPRPNDRWLEY